MDESEADMKLRVKFESGAFYQLDRALSPFLAKAHSSVIAAPHHPSPLYLIFFCDGGK
jgi:hypothetical protein